MEALKISISVSPQVAIRSMGREAGESAWPLAGVLPLLSDESRDWLACHWDQRESIGRIRSGGSVFSVALPAPPTDQVVADAIEGIRGAQILEAAKEAEKIEGSIVNALAAPNEDWVYPSSNGPYVLQDPRGIYLSAEARVDPRIVARRAEVTERALPAAIAEWQADKARAQAERDAEASAKAQALAEEQARHDAVRTWAVGCTDLPATVRRAASEGRDVYLAVLAKVEGLVTDAIVASLPDGASVIAQSYDWEPDARVPSELAYATRDAVLATADSIAAAAMLPDVTVTVSEFGRVDVAKHGRAVWRTGLDVKVTCPWYPDRDMGDRVLTESLALPSDEAE